MADYISMKQVPGGIVTATDDRILYDYLVNSGVVYGCEISYLGNNMIHINAGYGIIKGGLFEIEDHTEYVDYAESGAVNGQIYIHFDAAADDKITIVKETSATPHQLIQNEDANYENGIYEIQLCTFRATTTALTQVQQTFVKSVMPIDVLDTLEEIEANTQTNKAAGALAVKALNNNFAYDSNGIYGYHRKVDGADTVIPFNHIANGLIKGTGAYDYRTITVDTGKKDADCIITYYPSATENGRVLSCWKGGVSINVNDGNVITSLSNGVFTYYTNNPNDVLWCALKINALN